MTNNYTDKDIQEIRRLNKWRTEGLWGIGHINEDNGTMDVIARDTGEIIAEDVAEHNAGFLAIAPKMADMALHYYELSEQQQARIEELERQEKIYEGLVSTLQNKCQMHEHNYEVAKK